MDAAIIAASIPSSPSGDHHRMLSHVRTPAGMTPVTSGAPTRAYSSAKSGGAHKGISAPRARNRTASPTIASTFPSDSYVDNNTRISPLPFP
jgi:hypothetical protein